MSLSIPFFNIWAVLVCILFYMILGALWYSPVLFGNLWLKLIGKSADDIGKDEANKAMAFAFIPAIVNVVLLALVLAFTGARTIGDALILGSIVSAGFVGMSAMNLVLFEDRKIGLALLNTGYAFAALNVSAIVMVLWK